MNSSPVSLTPLTMPVPRRKSDLNKLKISATILILKKFGLPPTIPYVSEVTGIPKQRISEIEASELLSGCYRVDKLLLKPLLDSERLTKVDLKGGKFGFESQPRRNRDPSKAMGSRGKFFSIKKTAQMLAYEELRSKQSKKIEDALKGIENPAAAWLTLGIIMKSQIDYLEILTHPHTIEHVQEWYKLLEPIGRKALKLARETGVNVPEEYAGYYRFGWLKISIAVLTCMQSGVDMHMCLKKLSLNPCIRKIIDEYKATSEKP